MTARVDPVACIHALTARGFGPFIGVPCSFLRPFIDAVIDDESLTYVAATNEGEALAIAAGAQLAGQRPVVMLQNSGLGNLVNPLASLTHPFRIPVLLIVTLRGDPTLTDEPQHELMGRTTGALLDMLEVTHEWFPAADDAVGPALDRARDAQDATGHPFAFVLRKGVVAEYAPHRVVSDVQAPARPIRRDALAAVAAAIAPTSVVVATTGKTGREWFELGDRERNLYLVGSMGCAASVALGLSLATEAPLVVLDGDGAALMRLEAMASVGHRRPERFVHIILDNEAYDSTGAQRTIAGGVDFPAIARACGYATAESVADATALAAALRVAQATHGPHLLHLKIALGASPDLGRPTVAPAAVANRLRQSLTGTQ